MARRGQRRRDGLVLLRLQPVRVQVAEPLVGREHAGLEVLVDQPWRRTVEGDQHDLRRRQKVPLLELQYFQGTRPPPLRGGGLRAEGLSELTPQSTDVPHRCCSSANAFFSISRAVRTGAVVRVSRRG